MPPIGRSDTQSLNELIGHSSFSGKIDPEFTKAISLSCAQRNIFCDRTDRHDPALLSILRTKSNPTPYSFNSMLDTYLLAIVFDRAGLRPFGSKTQWPQLTSASFNHP